MKEFFIADAAHFDNQVVTTFFLLSSLQLRDRKQGGQYLALTVADKSGQMEARMWEEFAEAVDIAARDAMSRCRGRYPSTRASFRSH